MNYKNNAFTLTELLVALGIIGAIAALSIPSLLNNINSRMLATQLRSTVESIQQIATDQLVKNKTKTLKDTDFSNPTALLSETNFNVTKSCTSTTAQKDCWKIATSVPVNERITYKTINGGTGTVVAAQSAKLKNGVLISYYLSEQTIFGVTNDKVIGIFDIDVNGNDKPNIIGRDFFSVFVTEKGKLIDYKEVKGITNYNTLKSNCQNGAGWCLGVIMEDGWKMNY